MRTIATEQRLLVVSDMHLGNPSSTARARLVSFLQYALTEGASVCINGDGFDLAQTSFPRLAGDTIPVMSALRRILDTGQRVYYVVGNHDLVLEHFLSDLVFSHISPFLTVRSGDQRIRIEHGHLYDPWFSKAPASYQRATHAAGYFLVAVPDIYRTWDKGFAKFDRWNRQRRARKTADPDDGESRYHRAARDLLERGYDTVIFGHTHTAETVEFEGGTYINSGNWLRGNTYVDIDGGKATLKNWESIRRT